MPDAIPGAFSGHEDLVVLHSTQVTEGRSTSPAMRATVIAPAVAAPPLPQ